MRVFYFSIYEKNEAYTILYRQNRHIAKSRFHKEIRLAIRGHINRICNYALKRQPIYKSSDIPFEGMSLLIFTEESVMRKITTWSDAKELQGDLKDFISRKFVQLYYTYRETKALCLSNFSLLNYGEIYIAESYEDIKSIIFEEVQKVELIAGIVYIGTFLKNNEVCCDVLVYRSLLTTEQIKILETEL